MESKVILTEFMCFKTGLHSFFKCYLAVGHTISCTISCIKLALSNKLNNDRYMAIAIALHGFSNLGCLVTPIFPLMDHFLYQFSNNV